MGKDKTTCSFQLTAKDFLNFNYAINRKTMRFMYMYGVVLMGLVVVNEILKETVNVIPIIVGAVIVTLTFSVTFFNMVKKSNQGWEVNTAFHDPMKLVFDNKGFVCSTKNHMSTVPWGKVNKVVDSKRIVVIMLGQQAYLIPTRIENIQQVRSVIRENVTGKKRAIAKK